MLSEYLDIDVQECVAFAGQQYQWILAILW